MEDDGTAEWSDKYVGSGHRGIFSVICLDIMWAENMISQPIFYLIMKTDLHQGATSLPAADVCTGP